MEPSRSLRRYSGSTAGAPASVSVAGFSAPPPTTAPSVASATSSARPAPGSRALRLSRFSGGGGGGYYMGHGPPWKRQRRPRNTWPSTGASPARRGLCRVWHVPHSHLSPVVACKRSPKSSGCQGDRHCVRSGWNAEKHDSVLGSPADRSTRSPIRPAGPRAPGDGPRRRLAPPLAPRQGPPRPRPRAGRVCKCNRPAPSGTGRRPGPHPNARTSMLPAIDAMQQSACAAMAGAVLPARVYYPSHSRSLALALQRQIRPRKSKSA